jgi:hypothetical protein
MTYSPINSKTAYLPTTEFFPEDDDELLVKLSSVYSNIAKATNIKEIALYDTVEQINGQLFFDPNNAQRKRTGFRKVFQFGAVAPGGILAIAHGILRVMIFTRIYGTCITAAVDYRPIPYVNEALVTNQISIRASATNIFIANGATAPAITSGIVILEYLLT